MDHPTLSFFYIRIKALGDYATASGGCNGYWFGAEVYPGLSPRIRGVTVNPRPFLLPVVLGRYRGGRWNIASILQIDASICNCEPGRFAMCEPIAIKHNGH